MGQRPQTINQLFQAAVARYGDADFLKWKSDGAWRSMTYETFSRRVKELALALYSRGFKSDDRIAIWSENRPEWNIADLAALAIGAVDVPIYTTQARAQIEYVLNDCAAKAMFVSAAFLEEAIRLRDGIESLELIISFDRPDRTASGVVAVEELIEEGRALNEQKPNLYERLSNSVGPNDLATFIYTSGTTGDPKGVMLTHRNLAANAINSYEWLELDGRRDVALSYLPLSHIFERGVWYTDLYSGTVIAYAESLDTVAANLAEIRPTVMASVPRMFEKIYARIVEKGMAAGFPKRQIFIWSLGVGKRWAEANNQGRKPGLFLSLQHKLADALVFKKWRAAVGGNIRAFISGGAPLAPEIGLLFSGAGLQILEGYGLTETSPSISCNTERRNKIGTVGPIITGIKVKIADDGEILVKGDTVMTGYYHRLPEKREALTRETFTDDGWFKSGDIGYVDEDGFLVITDRKKELIKTSGGKYIAPQRIESLIKASRFVSQVVVVGNNRKFPGALIYPNLEMLHSYAKLKGIHYTGEDELLSHPQILKLLERQVDKATPELARFEKIKKIALLDRELRVENGELTPTLKPRRSVIDARYKSVIDRLYEEPAAELATAV